MEAPLFSIVVIAKNEEKTLPNLIGSLKEFLDRGGEIVVLDTNSTDSTVEVAKKGGCTVFLGKRDFIFKIEDETASAINHRFLVDNEPDIVRDGDEFFNYSQARNCAARMANKDIIFCYDADEVNARMDIDYINELIRSGVKQFEYNFVFAKDQYGNEAVKFVQSKAYDRREMEWTGIIHEVLQPLEGKTPKRALLSEDKYKLEHFQNHETSRHSYLKGLALDCYSHPEADRQSHYLARELMWNGRYRSAIKEFKRHIDMGKWPAERAQSSIFIGDCYGKLNNPQQQVGWYNRAFYIDDGRRESLIKLAQFYQHNNKPQAAACYASAALEIPYSGFYASDMRHYRDVPHAILYWAKGWLGDIKSAQDHLTKALEYSPYNPQYLHDTKYYFEYYDKGIPGWMTFQELQFLYKLGKEYKTIVEIGSFKGRSSDALASGIEKGDGGVLYCVDTWEGSEDVRDDTHWICKQEDVYADFKKMADNHPSIIPTRCSSVEASSRFFKNNKQVDCVFIDAGHTKKDVLEDIEAWLKTRPGLICGHDYKPDVWMGVVEAVNEKFGKPDGVEGTIWWVDLEKRYSQAE